MYFEMNADIVSFKILEEHMPSSETDISYCYFSDIEVNTDIVEKTWSKYTTGDVDALPISNGNENYLVIKVSPPGTPRYDDDRIDDLYQDRQSLYYVFVNTGDTPPPLRDIHFIIKKMDNINNMWIIAHSILLRHLKIYPIYTLDMIERYHQLWMDIT